GGPAPQFQPWGALAAAGLAYLLASFWLTPTFISTVAFNWPTDAFGYQLQNRQELLLGALAASIVAIWLAFRRLRGSFYFCFVTLCAFIFGWLATAFYVFGVDTIPESRRYALEFELFLILALAELFRLALRSSNSTVRLCVYGSGGLLLIFGLSQAWGYVTLPYPQWSPVPKASTIEYRLG